MNLLAHLAYEAGKIRLVLVGNTFQVDYDSSFLLKERELDRGLNQTMARGGRGHHFRKLLGLENGSVGIVHQAHDGQFHAVLCERFQPGS